VVNTMPEKTLDATFDHAVIEGDTVTGSYDASNQVLNDLQKLGISYQDVVQLLETEGLDKFVASWQDLVDHVQEALESHSAGTKA